MGVTENLLNEMVTSDGMDAHDGVVKLRAPFDPILGEARQFEFSCAVAWEVEDHIKEWMKSTLRAVLMPHGTDPEGGNLTGKSRDLDKMLGDLVNGGKLTL